VTRVVRKFIQMSYKMNGCGLRSRNAQFVVDQCVHLLYAMRCVYITHCLESLQAWDVNGPERVSLKYMNSTVPSAFTAIQNIKRPAKNCRQDNFKQNITWTSAMCNSLQVHTGAQGIGRIAVSHEILKGLFQAMLGDLRKELGSIGVPLLQEHEFDNLKDSLTSTIPGEGLGCYNNKMWAHSEFVSRHPTDDFRHTFLQKASKLNRLCMALIHISGGPSPRGTEEAVTRLINSETEQMRNIIMIDGTIGVQSG
jgi:hypothetical protein